MSSDPSGNAATSPVLALYGPVDQRLLDCWRVIGPIHVKLPASFNMAYSFGTDILIQAQDPTNAAQFYVEHLGFEITDIYPKMIGLHGNNINLFIEPGLPLGPVLEVTVADVA